MSSAYSSSNRFSVLAPLPVNQPSTPATNKPNKPAVAPTNGHAVGKSPVPTQTTHTPQTNGHVTPPLKKARRRDSLRTAISPQQDPSKPARREIVTKKTDWEIPRKTLHGSIGFLVLYFHTRQPRTLLPLLKGLSGALAVVTVADILRFRSASFNLLYIRLCGPLMRKSEEKDWNGVIWYLIGCLVSLGLFPRDVAVVSILTLSWSDTGASTIGRAFSAVSPRLPERLPILGIPFARRKSLAGFLAAAVTGFFIGCWWWWDGKRSDGGWGDAWGGDRDLTWWTGEKLGSWDFLRGGQHNLLDIRLASKPLGMWLTSAVLGITGAVVEALDLGYDDNLTLPILTGSLVWIWLTLVSLIA